MTEVNRHNDVNQLLIKYINQCLLFLTKIAMPYLQLEVNEAYPIAIKKQLAKRMGEAYASIMKADVNRITVSIRSLEEGSVWRCSDSDPYPGALLMCDVRAGRSKEIRTVLSKALILICNELLELETNQLNIEFTQHTGDEMYHQRLDGFSADWTADEGPISNP
jgi:phenylpyruvate tautomerase PptA (4-oxalocrotonate tautomerase family)